VEWNRSIRSHGDIVGVRRNSLRLTFFSDALSHDLAICVAMDSAHLILLLVSEHFLDSEYCFGVEVEKALARLKRKEVRVVPILLKPCLWKESPFCELQILPRDAKAITSWPSQDEAFLAVANEILSLVSAPSPEPIEAPAEPNAANRFKQS
jgi:hypothetical protein